MGVRCDAERALTQNTRSHASRLRERQILEAPPGPVALRRRDAGIEYLQGVPIHAGS